MEDKKAIQIGRFNIVDIAAVIVVLAVLAFAAFRLLSREEPETATIDVKYVVRVEGVAAELYDNCQAHLPSALMASGALVGGQIESVEKAPYLVLGPDGQWVEDPNHVTLYFTATTQSPKEDVMTTKIGEQEIRIGKTDYILKSEYIEFQNSTVVDIEWGE